MPKVTPLQQSFSAGEISPLMLQRSDTEGHRQGLMKMTNMRADSRGPAVSRPGTGFVVGFDGNDARMMTFPTSDDSFAAMVFVDLKLFVYSVSGVSEEFVTPYLEDELIFLQHAPNPEGNIIYILHESHPPHKLSYQKNTDTFLWEEVAFTGAPAEWLEGNHPATGDFFEGRLWLGGTPDEPQTFWGSVSGIPEDFTLGTEADDAIMFTVAKYGRIRWMMGFKNLVIGTQNGEHIVTSEGGFIQPSDILVQQQSSYGSARIQPMQVGDQIFYVSADGRKLRAIQYEWQADNWLSRDLTFNSEHITEAGIRSISWQQNPHNLFHCVLQDGTVATLTYERSNNIYGWGHSEWGGEGWVLDASNGPLYGTDYGMFLISYAPGKIYFELEPTITDPVFMDSWAIKSVETDLVTVVGLNHLEGQQVQILVDDARHPDEVVIGGQITLEREAFVESIIIVGLQFVRGIVTLPFDKGSQIGPAPSWMKRYNKLYVRLLDSTKPMINGERNTVRQPSTPMGRPEEPATADMFVINLGYSKNAQVIIEQDLPYALTVLGIYGELDQEIV